MRLDLMYCAEVLEMEEITRLFRVLLFTLVKDVSFEVVEWLRYSGLKSLVLRICGAIGERRAKPCSMVLEFDARVEVLI